MRIDIYWGRHKVSKHLCYLGKRGAEVRLERDGGKKWGVFGDENRWFDHLKKRVSGSTFYRICFGRYAIRYETATRLVHSCRNCPGRMLGNGNLPDREKFDNVFDWK